MSQLELNDIQGIILSAYSKLSSACYLCLRIDDADSTRHWLRDVADKVRLAKDAAPGVESINLAFTYPGLQKLGLPFQALKGFSAEFQEGMAGNDYRSAILGDIEESAPTEWEWGGPKNERVDLLLMLFAPNDAGLDGLKQAYRSRFASAGLCEVKQLTSTILSDFKEHFGFRDGISQPKVAGATQSRDPAQLVKSGEFLLGYENEHGQVTMSPLVDPIEDRDSILPLHEASGGLHDFGRNGSYLVFRQLAQDVRGLWRWIDNSVRGSSGGSTAEARIGLAAKMVGRWPGGAPLTCAPDRDDPALAQENEFRFHRDGDADGLRCPIGAHIRRTNPRDSLAPKPGSESSLAINRRHRLLRRGRPYGEPLDESMSPDAFLASGDAQANAPRGLLFLCVNANLSRQFEFVQHAWINNGHFAGLQGETDPLLGDRSNGAGLTIPGSPARTHVAGLPRFVTVSGGAYFFLPGARALRYLATAPRILASEYAAPAPPAVYLAASIWLRMARGVSNVLEASISFTRRFTRTRRVFDRLFQQGIVNSVQYLLQRRLRDEGLAIAEEQIMQGEGEIAQRITEHMTQFLFKHYREGVAERAGNTKTYGLVKAQFEVLSGLDPSLRVGIFKEVRSYPAWVRFGGPGPLVTPDIKNNGIMSLGIKLMGVEGERFFDDERSTQDFTAISAPTFTTPTVFENLKLQRNIGRGTPVFYFLNPFDSHFLDAILQGVYAKAHANPLEASFWSCVPYLFGTGRAMKYSLKPRIDILSHVPRRPSDNYLREAMVASLAAQEWCFDFFLQMQTDPVRMPIENSSVIWPESLSPQIKVATLRIPRQSFDSDEQLAFARKLSFNPWHCIREHRPLGNQGRARKHIYNETSKVRQRINAEERIEPTGAEF